MLLSLICVCLSSVIFSCAEPYRNTNDWSWGKYEDRIANNGDRSNNGASQRATASTKKTTTTTTQAPNSKLTDEEIAAKIPVCARYPRQVPDYSKPDRRLSDVKCLETIWDIRYRKTVTERQLACTIAIEKAKGYDLRPAIGGRDANDGEFPHMGALGWKAARGNWTFKCGAILISDKFVLTAGHCTQVSRKDTSVSDIVPKIVRLGDKNILDVNRRKWSTFLPVDAIISRIIKHPSYKSPVKYNDIAIMEFESPVQFTYQVHPACLWSKHITTFLGKKATLTGWGVIDTSSQKTSPILQVAVVDMIDQEQCDSLLRPSCNRLWCGIRDDQICAGKLEGGVDACQGDSGGPLQVKLKLQPQHTDESLYYVIGVTSFGIGCAKPNTPGVYTRISSYIDWIEQTVWGGN